MKAKNTTGSLKTLYGTHLFILLSLPYGKKYFVSINLHWVFKCEYMVVKGKSFLRAQVLIARLLRRHGQSFLVRAISKLQP